MTDPMSPAVPAGWYPAPHANNEQRYWDGTKWTEWTPESAAAAQTAVQAPAAASAMASAPSHGTTLTAIAETPGGPAEKKPGLRWWVWVLIVVSALVVLGIIIGGINGRSSDTGAAPETRPSVAAVEEAEAEPEETRVEVPDVTGKTVAEARAAIEAAGLTFTIVQGAGDDWVVLTQTITQPSEPGTEILVTAEAPKPVYTLAQQNAIREAQSYLQYSGFSRAGLIGQLEYEGYSTEDATFGADNAGADWNAEAAETAKSYLEYTSFSRDGLYDQMAYEQFTDSEILFALAAVGY